MRRSLVFCEGFHDRSFWAGWLACLGFQDPGAPAPGTPSRRQVFDPVTAERVEGGGQFAFHIPARAFVIVIPCSGHNGIRARVSRKLRDGQRDPTQTQQIVLCVDSDLDPAAEHQPATLPPDSVHNLLRTYDPECDPVGDGPFSLFDGQLRVDVIRWRSPDPVVPGVPAKQTLEQLVCSALARAYPQRAAAVEEWLASRPDPEATSPKHHSWSYMAGWFAEAGCDAFYRLVWQDDTVRPHLERQLKTIGAWPVAESLRG